MKFEELSRSDQIALLAVAAATVEEVEYPAKITALNVIDLVFKAAEKYAERLT
jgi:hypothetical protein